MDIDEVDDGSAPGIGRLRVEQGLRQQVLLATSFNYKLMSNHELVQHAIAAIITLVEKDSFDADDNCDLDAVDMLADRAEQDSDTWVELVAALVNMTLNNAVPLISMIVDILALPSPNATAALTKHLLSVVNAGEEVQARNCLIIWRALSSKLAGQRSVDMLSDAVLSALLDLLDPSRPAVLLLHAILALEGFAGTGVNKQRIVDAGVRDRLKAITEAYRDWRTVELKRRFSECGPKECPPVADPTGGCCAPARHDECCAGDCQLSHVVEGITDQESASCHSLGAAASSPSPPPPRLSSSSWGFEVDLGSGQDPEDSPHNGRKDSFSECMPLSVSPVPAVDDNMRRGSGPLLILSGTEHNLYEHQHHVILSPREQMILSYAQEQYPVGPPLRRHSGTSPPGPVSPSPMRAHMPPGSSSRPHSSSVTSQPAVMFSSPLAQSPSNSFLITSSARTTSPDRAGRPASARLAASQGADPHSRWARTKPRVHAAAAGDLSRSGEGGGLFHPDHKGRYGPSADMLTEAQAQLVEAEVWFCADWSLRNIFFEPNAALNAEALHVHGLDNINAMLSWKDSTKFLKLAGDGLEARNDEMTFESVRSTMSVTGGKWFYEVTVLTGGIMQIGWATRDCEYLSEEGGGVGDDRFSYAIDGCRRLKWHDARGTPLGTAKSWLPGDCIGLYLNLDDGFIAFTVNAVPTCGFQHVVSEDDKHWHAAVSLMAAQHCRFNFGSEPFRFGPPPEGYQVFNEVGTLTDAEKLVLPRYLRQGQATAIPIDSDQADDIDDGDLCSICFERPANTQLKSCGHRGFCSRCVLLCEHCPLCRQPIESRRTIPIENLNSSNDMSS